VLLEFVLWEYDFEAFTLYLDIPIPIYAINEVHFWSISINSIDGRNTAILPSIFLDLRQILPEEIMILFLCVYLGAVLNGRFNLLQSFKLILFLQ